MAKLEIRAQELGSALGQTWHHLEMIVTLDSGQQFVVEGGPEFQGGGLGDVFSPSSGGESQDQSNSFGRLLGDITSGPGDPGTQLVTSVDISDRQAREALRSAQSTLREISGRYDYSPLYGPNSNTLVGAVAENIERDTDISIGDLSQHLRNRDIWAPAVEKTHQLSANLTPRSHQFARAEVDSSIANVAENLLARGIEDENGNLTMPIIDDRVLVTFNDSGDLMLDIEDFSPFVLASDGRIPESVYENAILCDCVIAASELLDPQSESLEPQNVQIEAERASQLELA